MTASLIVYLMVFQLAGHGDVTVADQKAYVSPDACAMRANHLNWMLKGAKFVCIPLALTK